MKKFITLILIINGFAASAQWSNTTNLFYDSLHMPVSTALKTQAAPIVLQSYPDSGYFVIWEDARNDPANTKAVIYAQKYDNNGNQLWANNGIPLSASTNNQYYTFQSGIDYRSRSFAATDSAGGFFISYADDSVTNYVWQRACVQHVLSTGNTVFPKGYILATSPNANFNMMPQLIADGNKGFFVSFRTSTTYVYVYCYKESGGSLQSFGGGIMNENAVQLIASSPCGNYSYVQYPDASVNDYNIFSDLQGGCNIVMNLSGNGTQGQMLAYNKLFRAKKNSTATQHVRGIDYTDTTIMNTYQQNNVYRLYYVVVDHQEIHCGSNPNVYVVNQYRLDQLGYQVIDGLSPATIYDLNYAKGVTVSTTGNINVTFLGCTKRSYLPVSGVSNASVFGYNLKEEIYDSIPYQRASDTSPDYPGYNTTEPAGLNKLNFFRDSLLAQGVSNYDFSLSGGSNQIFSSALMADPSYTTFSLALRLQHLAVERQSADSFAVVYKTTKKIGELIGKDQGDTRYSTEFSLPTISVNKNGVALFDIKDNYDAGARVSPIFNGAQLAWGALGRQVGTGVYNGSYYNVSSPNISLDPLTGKGLIAWSDDRNASTSGSDIFMRHLDSLNLTNYYPPVKRIRLIPNPYGATNSLPAVLYGVSKRYTLLETYAPYNDVGVTPVSEIKDDNYLGLTTTRVYQNTGSIRKYNGKAYLDRNFTIYADSVPPNSNFDIRLYFTKIEFNTLKANDNSVSTPADLVVIKQPHNSSSYPTSYTPVANEQLLTPVAWDSVAGGYYVEVIANSLGDFFIQKSSIASLCPGGSTSITSNITGTSYQWKVNTGTGFVNVTNNTNYTGATSVTLQLNNIPSSWAGYQYMVVVNGTTNGNITTLKFLNTWSGAANNNWDNAANWSCGSVPDANTDVILNSGTVVVNSNAACRTIAINPGVSFTVTTGVTFTVTH